MVAMPRIYDQTLDSAPANYTPLNPTSFLTRAERVYCDHADHDSRPRPAYLIADRGALSASGRCVASTWHRHGRYCGCDGPKIPEVLQAHYGVRMIGAMANLLNIRLSAGWCWRSNKALVVLLLRM